MPVSCKIIQIKPKVLDLFVCVFSSVLVLPGSHSIPYHFTKCLAALVLIFSVWFWLFLEMFHSQMIHSFWGEWICDSLSHYFHSVAADMLYNYREQFFFFFLEIAQSKALFSICIPHVLIIKQILHEFVLSWSAGWCVCVLLKQLWMFIFVTMYVINLMCTVESGNPLSQYWDSTQSLWISRSRNWVAYFYIFNPFVSLKWWHNQEAYWGKSCNSTIM